MTLNNLREREEGFTLIELLVVVIIIGILAAIAIPTFLNQREKSWDAAAKSDLANAAIAQESFATENNGDYTGDEDDLTDPTNGQGLNISDGVTFAIVTPAAGATGTAYCMTATHEDSDNTWELDSAVGTIVEGNCT